MIIWNGNFEIGDIIPYNHNWVNNLQSSVNGSEVVTRGSLHIQIPPDGLHRAHITQYNCGYCKL